MINASHALSPACSPAPLRPAIIRRRARPLLLASPKLPVATVPVVSTSTVAPADWRSDLRFFAGCYVAGLAFFLIMLS